MKENQYEDLENEYTTSGRKEKGLKVTEQRLCNQTRMIKMNGWLTELEMNATKKCMMNENANKNDQNSGNDDNGDQGEATEKFYKCFTE